MQRYARVWQWQVLLLWASLLAVTPIIVHCGVIVTAVRPNRGSLAGGTRLHIQVHLTKSLKHLFRSNKSLGTQGALVLTMWKFQGSGFSTNTGGSGNIVMIGGKYFCDPIPLHCTVVQIACKTRPALEGLFVLCMGHV